MPRKECIDLDSVCPPWASFLLVLQRPDPIKIYDLWSVLLFFSFRLRCVKYRVVVGFILVRLCNWKSVLDKGALSWGDWCVDKESQQRLLLCVRASLRPCHREAYFPPTAKCPLKCESGKLGLMWCLEIKVVAMKAWSFTRFCALWEFCRLSAKVLSQQSIDLWIAAFSKHK